jgi:hypothetical protein
MGTYKRGDFVKFEVQVESSDASEWMWLIVEESDDVRRIVIGKLDSQPIVNTDMRLGMTLAISYDKIRDHRTAASFDN